VRGVVNMSDESLTQSPTKREIILLLIVIAFALAYAAFLLTSPPNETTAEQKPEQVSAEEPALLIVRCGSAATEGADLAIKATGFIVEQVDGVLVVTTFHHNQPVQTQEGDDLLCTVTMENDNETAAG